MTQEFINTIVAYVYSQVLMTSQTEKEFSEWLSEGHYNDEFEMAEILMRKGEWVDPKSFYMGAWAKFNA